MRRSYVFLLIVTALAGFCCAQDLGSSMQKPSQSDCLLATYAGRPLPAGCEQGGGASVGMGQQAGALSPVQPPQFFQGRSEIPEPAIVAPPNPSQLPKVQTPPRPHTEFEQVVADTVGRPLPLYGQSLFEQPPSTFAPTTQTQVPGDYEIGPDDVLQIRIWGQINADLRVVVDRSGQIYIPHVGPVAVAGVHYRDLDAQLKAAVLKYFRNFHLTVNIARIRSIQIYVVGQARYPGTYTISALATLVNAVFASGGPTPEGSLRDVQVQRAGKTIAHMDFYDLLVRGDKSKDIALQSGDVLYYPPVGPLAAVTGSVNAPAIYEMKPGSSLDELLEIAGGLSTVADPGKVTVERMGDPDGASERSVLEFPLDAQSRALPLRDGDIVRVFSMVPRYSNAVTLRGNVANPGRYPWKPGMRVRDLIPNAQALLTRPYWLGRDAMVDGRSTEYPVRGDHANNAALYASLNSTGDVPGGSDPAKSGVPGLTGHDALGGLANGESAGAAGGNAAGRVPRDLINQKLEEAGFRQNPNSRTLTADLHLASPEINWNYAIIQRVNPVDLSTKLLSFNLGKAVLDGDPANNLPLQPDDIITIFSQSDVSVPQSMRARYVSVEGEVMRAGVYRVQEGESLRDVIRSAGGLTPQAYLYGTQLTRESAREQQQKSIDELTRALEVEMHQASVSATTRGTPDDMQAITARQAAQDAMIAELRNTKATGRVVLNLRPNAKSVDAYPEIPMEDNDRIYIPHLPSTVSVVGMVYNPGSFVYNPRRKVGDYLKLAGKGRPNADEKHEFVLRADGSVVARSSVNGMFAGDRFDQLRLYPGDEVVVPNKIRTGDFVRGLRDWTQISSQLALTGAALAVIH